MLVAHTERKVECEGGCSFLFRWFPVSATRLVDAMRQCFKLHLPPSAIYIPCINGQISQFPHGDHEWRVIRCGTHNTLYTLLVATAEYASNLKVPLVKQPRMTLGRMLLFIHAGQFKNTKDSSNFGKFSLLFASWSFEFKRQLSVIYLLIFYI